MEEGKAVLVIGESGSGKSLVSNTIVGNEIFKESVSAQNPESKQFQKAHVNLKINEISKDLIFVEGPSNIKERKAIKEDFEKFKEISSVLIVLNGEKARVDDSAKQLLMFYKNLLGKEFSPDFRVIITRWAQDKKSVNRRSAMTTPLTEESKIKDMGEELAKILKVSSSRIKYFFIDGSLNNQENFNEAENNEKEIFNKCIENIRNDILNSLSKERKVADVSNTLEILPGPDLYFNSKKGHDALKKKNNPLALAFFSTTVVFAIFDFLCLPWTPFSIWGLLSKKACFLTIFMGMVFRIPLNILLRRKSAANNHYNKLISK